MAVRNWVMDAWRRVSLRNGFEEYDGPIFEELDLYRAKSGEGIVAELFHFRDRGDRELAIRPEMTPTMARMISARAQSLPRPIKWFSVPRLCRAERPQRGRLREFFQWNVDIVGTNDVLSDAECIFVAVDFFREMGLTPADMVMKINDRALLSSLLLAKGIGADRHDAIFAVLDKRDKIPGAAFTEMLSKITGGAEELALLQAIGQSAGPDGLDHLQEVGRGNEAAEAQLSRLRSLFDHLHLMGAGEYCRFDMGVVRGLAYYTGVVFEGFGQGLGRAICGGGRYDNLLEVLGGPPMSGIGFGTSDVVIVEVLSGLGKVPSQAAASRPVEFFVIDAEEALFPEVLRLTAQLRRQGRSAEFSYRRQAMGKQFKQASAAGSAMAVIVGRELKESGLLTIKDLVSGHQTERSWEEFLQEAGKRL
jgi:histidyl-tRNA synthetase